MSEHRKKQRAEELVPVIEQSRELAEELGLSPRDCSFWVIDHEEMNQLIAYNGFQSRYPHWRWGMAYERQSIMDRYGLGLAYELVINDDPAHAYLQEQNSMVEQKSVIAHVMGHLDFFEKNPWFDDHPDAAAMLERHGRRIRAFMEDPDIGREAVETWIDHVLCLEDNIDQYFRINRGDNNLDEETPPSLTDRIETLGLSEDVREQIFNDDWLTEQEQRLEEEGETAALRKDILGYLLKNGMQYDDDSDRAVEYEDWQREVVEMLREEAYYFAPQKLTKVMNEGWAAFWESLMMTDEAFATTEEIIDYADHHAKILDDSGGQFNPYTLGKELWEYVENTANRDAVINQLLRVEGITPQTFFDDVDFDHVQSLFTHPTHEDIVVRNFSLGRPKNSGFLRKVTRASLLDQYRYIMDTDVYATIEEAIDDLDYEAGWTKMRDVRASKNDVTFIDEFLNGEFIEEEGYFTYEFSQVKGQMEITSREARDVKRKLLMMFTNFGKPPITVGDGNYDNKGELLLAHRYNGIKLHMPKAAAVLKRAFELWGRPVHLYTVTKGDDDIEKPLHVMYDGEELSTPDINWADVKPYISTDMSFKTARPEPDA